MREWIRHNHRHPCPVCHETKKGCRTNAKTNNVHCRGENPSPEYRFLKEDKHGFGIYKLEAEIEEFSEQKKQEWLEQKRLERERREREWQKQLEAGLSPKERDCAVQKIISQLPLTKEDRSKLKARGFSNSQINQAGYFSLTQQWQKLKENVTPALAGVNRYGTGLVNFDTGIGVPVPDENGYFVGFQYRRDNPNDGNKYPWSASETNRENRPTVHNKDGELPLGVWGEASGDGTVYLCESPGIKPYMASVRLNRPVIGAAGNNFASSPKALYRALTQLGAKKIIILPDAGAIINRHIHRQIEQAIDLLFEWGYQDISIGWWNQIEKSDGDIDEISEETLAGIEYLSTAQYRDKAKELQRDRYRRDTKNAIAKLTNVDKRINKKYFQPEDLDIPEGCHVAYLVGSQGTGKSAVAKSQAIQAIQNGKAAFGITHRRLLSRSMARNWSQGNTYVPFVEDRGGPYNGKGFTFVINSMHFESQAQFNPNDPRLQGAFILFDEFDQVLDALFNDSTMEHRRALIAQNLAKTIQNVVSGGGTIIFASADIYDFHKQFVNDIFNQAYGFEPKSYTVVNDYNPVAEEGCELRFYDNEGPDDSPAGIYADTVQLIDQGNKILIQTTSQSVESPYGSKTLESDLGKRYPNLKILRWDSETNRDPNHEAFGFAEKLANDPTVIEYYDLIIMSPVGETGISVDDPNQHFNYNVAIFNSGNQDTRAIKQTIRRERQLIPRLVYVAPRSNAKIGTGKTTPRGILRDNSRQVAKLKSVLFSAGVTEEENGLDLGNGDDFQIFLKPWAYSATLKNLDFSDYRKAAREALESEGYTIERTSEAYDILLGYEYSQGYEQAKEELGETRNDNKEAHYEAVVDKPNPDDDRYEQLQNKNDKTANEQLEQEKGFLSRAYNIEIDYRLVEKHNEGRKDWLQKLKLHYHLTIGADFLPKKERSMLESLTEGAGKPFSPEAVRKSRLLKIYWLKEFGIDQFLDQSSDFEDGVCTNTTFTEDDLQAWYDSVIQRERELKQSLGISVWGKNKDKEWVRVAPKTLADRFLGLIDMSLATLRRRDGNGGFINCYRPCRIAKQKELDLLPLKADIFQAWLQKDKEAQESAINHKVSGTDQKFSYMYNPNNGIFDQEVEAQDQHNNKTHQTDRSEGAVILRVNQGILAKAKEVSQSLNDKTIPLGERFSLLYNAIADVCYQFGEQASNTFVRWLKWFVTAPEIAEILA